MSYVEVIRGTIKKEECEPSKENILEMEKTQEEYYRRLSTYRYQRSLKHCEGNNQRKYHDKIRHDFKSTTSKRGALVPKYQSFFLGYCFNCTNFGHKILDCRAYGRNVQEINVYMAPYNIECYKCHNLGHIARDCRSMMDNSMR